MRTASRTQTKGKTMNRIHLTSATLLITAFIAGSVTLWAAEHPEKASEKASLDAVVKEVELTDKLNLGVAPRFGRQHPELHRIRSEAAYKRLGGKKAPVEFAKEDLVVVKGSTGCSVGKVLFRTDKEKAIFSVKIVKRCTHRSAQLHKEPYTGSFSINKEAKIAEYVFIDGRGGGRPQGKIGDKLKNTDAKTLMLSNCGVTDDDMVKLKEFQNLTHIHLHGNRITDKGLENLSHMTTLFQLHLDDNTGITDKALEQLRGPMTSKMQIIGISGTGITGQGLAKLREWGTQQDDKRGPQINHSIVTPQVYD